MMHKKLVVLAVGGNSLITDPLHRSVPDQFASCMETCSKIVKLLEKGYRVVITHGNGPQVGFMLRRAELAAHELHRVPLDSCGADTQGALGYAMQRALYNCTEDWAQRVDVATVVTQVLVDADDPAFENPAKPIGSFMDAEKAAERVEKDGWVVLEDAGRGFRRVVPSPRPNKIVELDAIRLLLEGGYVVVAVGGGGIPVVERPDGGLDGVEAVIDKDHASSLLARKLNADILLISTSVEKACLHFGTPEEQAIDTMTVSEARQYIREGHFKPGSMLPKVEAMIEFVEAGGGQAALTDPANLVPGLAGETGTRIVPDPVTE